MNRALVERIAEALLYEGYVLYPYRPSSVKNRKRWTPGALYPLAWGASDPTSFQAQCLVRGDGATVVAAELRFLRLVERTEPGGVWQEAERQDVAAPARRLGELDSCETAFQLDEHDSLEGTTRRRREALAGALELSVEALEPGLYRVTTRATNRSALAPGADRSAAFLRALVSAHAVISVSGGELVSLLEPEGALRAHVASCANAGVFPVLVGEPGARDAMLASPILLYDYPEVAPESPGNFFDSTEIDELLTLRILTLTEEEKLNMRAVDERARSLLERTEALADEDRLELHGTLRTPPVPGITVGTRVRLRPGARADIMDLALAGCEATVASVETDLEGRVHVAVTVDDDPGKDLGADRQVGHRFFFGLDEVEPLDARGKA
jgi:hypothetical protein